MPSIADDVMGSYLSVNGKGSPPLTAQIRDEKKRIDLALRTIRCLVADLCEQFKGGHPG